jgi:hypothetical protein
LDILLESVAKDLEARGHIETQHALDERARLLETLVKALEDETDSTIELAPGVYKYAVKKIRQALLMYKNG